MTRAELRELCEKATAGPWKNEHDDCGFIVGFDGKIIIETQCLGGRRGEEAEANAAFIVASRTTIPALLDRIEELERVMGVMADALKDAVELMNLAGYSTIEHESALSEHAKLMEGEDA